MTSHRMLCLFAAFLVCAGAGALAQTAKAPPSLVVVLGADMAASCKEADTERARKVAAACNDKQQCAFTPAMGDAASEACARDSVVLWNCGDGRTREAALAPKDGQSREIRLECPKMAVATDEPQKPDNTEAVKVAAQPQKPQSQKPDTTETVKVEGKQISPALMALRRSVAPLDMSEAGVSREMNRSIAESFKGMPGLFATSEGGFVDGAINPGDGQQVLDQTHRELYRGADHSASSPLNKEGHTGGGP